MYWVGGFFLPWVMGGISKAWSFKERFSRGSLVLPFSVIFLNCEPPLKIFSSFRALLQKKFLDSFSKILSNPPKKLSPRVSLFSVTSRALYRAFQWFRFTDFFSRAVMRVIWMSCHRWGHRMCMCEGYVQVVKTQRVNVGAVCVFGSVRMQDLSEKCGLWMGNKFLQIFLFLDRCWGFQKWQWQWHDYGFGYALVLG